MPVRSVWLPPARYWQAALHSPHKQWLLSRGSLTAYLIALSAGHFKVQVLHQAWSKPRFDEQQALGLKHTDYAWIREVALLGNGQVWVTARSVIPHQTLHGKGKRLKYLGSRSLGSLLFNGGKRGQMWIHAPNQHQKYWTRRSCFYYGGQALLVQESFLPALFEVSTTRQIQL